MANDKKSFLAYADWKAQFNLLSNEEAGILIKHILSYVNDEDPELPEDSRIIKIAFEPIKLQLKRDLKKYEGTKQEKITNGIIGNLKRWHIDLYEKYQNKEISLDEAQNIANARRKSHSDSDLSPPIANIAVTVTDTVNVNDTVTVTDTVIKDIGGENKFSPTPSPKKTLEERKASFQESINPYRQKYCREMLNEFWRYWTEIGENDKKMRFEKEKTFGVGRRLTTWKNNESKFGKRENDKGRVRHEPSRQISSYGKL